MGPDLRHRTHDTRIGDEMNPTRSPRTFSRSSGAQLLRECVSAAFIGGLALSMGALPLQSVSAQAASTPVSLTRIIHTPLVAPPHWSWSRAPMSRIRKAT